MKTLPALRLERDGHFSNNRLQSDNDYPENNEDAIQTWIGFFRRCLGGSDINPLDGFPENIRHRHGMVCSKVHEEVTFKQQLPNAQKFFIAES